MSLLKQSLEDRRIVSVEHDGDGGNGEVHALTLLLDDGSRVELTADGAYDAIWINYEIKPPLLKPGEKKK